MESVRNASISHVSEQIFQIVFDGPDAQGSMDIAELGPALQSLAYLIRDSNKILNGSHAEAEVRVQANPESGSFVLTLVLHQNLMESAHTLLANHGVITAGGIVAAIFGSNEKARDAVKDGIVWLYKRLKGEAPPQPTIDQSTNNYIYVLGDNNTIEVPPETAKLYESETIRRTLDGVFKPLVKPGIEKFQARVAGVQTSELSKEDVPERVEHPTSIQRFENEDEPPVKVWLKVTRINFDKGQWGFSDGGSKFSAAIEDKNFLASIERREQGFFAGDTLEVLLKRTQVLAENGSITAKYAITNVLQHKHQPQPRRLLEANNSEPVKRRIRPA